jgi:hypothetical protein
VYSYIEIEKGYRRIVEQEISPWEERKYEDEQLEEKWKGEDKQGRTLDPRSRWHLTLRENRTKLEKASSSPEFFIPTSINLTIPPLSSKRRPKHQIPPSYSCYKPTKIHIPLMVRKKEAKKSRLQLIP